MSWFKKSEIKNQIASAYKIQVIPDDFYGGRDPKIFNSHSSGKKNGSEKKVETTLRDYQSLPIFNLFKNKRNLLIITGIFFVIAIGLISWFYVNQALNSKKAALVTNTPVIVNPNLGLSPTVTLIPTVTTSEEIVTTTLDNISVTSTPLTATSLEEQTLVFPDVNLKDAEDSDSDSLTDNEEEIFGSDSAKWDTDSDGYYDGQEVNNLYNPKGVAPVKLIDSGLVVDYVNPVWQYRIYYPMVWLVASVDKNSNQVLFSAPTGDFISLEVHQKDDSETFIDWFSRASKGQYYGDLISFKNRFQVEGMKRRDDLVAYYIKDNNVFVLIYHPGSTGLIPFRHTMEMMVNSFRTGKSLIGIPEQIPLPPEGVVTSQNDTVLPVLTTNSVPFTTGTGFSGGQ